MRRACRHARPGRRGGLPGRKLDRQVSAGPGEKTGQGFCLSRGENWTGFLPVQGRNWTGFLPWAAHRPEASVEGEEGLPLPGHERPAAGLLHKGDPGHGQAAAVGDVADRPIRCHGAQACQSQPGVRLKGNLAQNEPLQRQWQGRDSAAGQDIRDILSLSLRRAGCAVGNTGGRQRSRTAPPCCCCIQVGRGWQQQEQRGAGQQSGAKVL